MFDRCFNPTRIPIFKTRPGQEIRTDHLQAISPRFVLTEHESGDLERLLDYRNLALVELELDNLPRLSFLARQMLFDFTLESLFRHLFGAVQPGCTIELLSIPTSDLRKFGRL